MGSCAFGRIGWLDGTHRESAKPAFIEYYTGDLPLWLKKN
jgi:hypothetical protein